MTQQRKHLLAIVVLVAALMAAMWIAQQHLCRRLAATQAAAFHAYSQLLLATHALDPAPFPDTFPPLPVTPARALFTLYAPALTAYRTALLACSTPPPAQQAAYTALQAAIEAYNRAAWTHNIQVRKYPDLLLPSRFVPVLPYFPEAQPLSTPQRQ